MWLLMLLLSMLLFLLVVVRLLFRTLPLWSLCVLQEAFLLPRQLLPV